MMSNVGWGEYALGDLFEIRTSRKRFDANKVTILRSGGHPYVVRQDGNNGQKGFIIEDEQYLNPGNTIAFGQDTATVTYQPTAYFTGDKVKVLVPRFKGFSRATAPVFVAAIRRSFSSYSWGGSSFSTDNLAKELVRVPSKDGAPAIGAITRFVTELEARHVAELKAYFTATGLSEQEISVASSSTLAKKLSAVEWGEFRIGDLFDIHPTRAYRLTNGDLFSSEGNIPVVTNSSSNNGITGYSSLSPTEIGPMLTFSDTTTGDCIFVQPRPFIGYPHVQGLYPVEQPKEWDCASLLFVASLMSKSARGRFSYGHKFTRDSARDIRIMLPLQGDGSINFQAMRHVVAELKALYVAELEAYRSFVMHSSEESDTPESQPPDKGNRLTLNAKH